MTRFSTFVLSGLFVFLGACSDTPVSSTSVEGQWCGKAVVDPKQCTGDGVEYAELKASGPAVTGRMCEAFDKDCYAILAGALSGTELTFYYTFGTDRVDAALTLNGDILEGQFTSTKATKPIPIELHRIP